MEKDSLTQDLVCGMMLRVDKVKATYTYHEKVYYFCGMGCLERFKKEPDKYIKKEKEGKIRWEET